jgi:hypothetical protein
MVLKIFEKFHFKMIINLPLLLQAKEGGVNPLMFSSNLSIFSENQDRVA